MKATRGFGVGTGLAAGVYLGYVGATWSRYGNAPDPSAEEGDALLDRFMPRYEVADRHHVRIAAPAGMALETARSMDMFAAPLVSGIFRTRQLILGATGDVRPQSRGLLQEMQSLGWAVLADVPRREIVVGTATRPWEPDVTFRPISADEFTAFSEPGYVKIAWTLRADPIDGETASIFRTETRVTSTDPFARAKFRRYWSFLSPGIIIIRRLLLAHLKDAAERQFAETRAPQAKTPPTAVATKVAG
jgi:hypothetical protein